MTTEAGPELTEMTWDPITRIVGSLGIYTKIDFKAKRVAECHSTSSIFRGYSIFMKGKDPRDAHFITSRICGICGDNHATCSVYNQNMAYGVRPPHLGEWIINLGEAAEYMFDHNIFQENLVGVDFCEKMVAETNPGVLERANATEAPHAGDHGYRTIGDIMRSLNPLEGEFYREALQVSRSTREMFCLMEGRHVHPSTLYPGGVGTVATVQLFTDYLTRLRRCPATRRSAAGGCCSAAGAASRTPSTATSPTGTWRPGAARCSSPRASWWTASCSPRPWSTSTWASGSSSVTRSTRTGRTRRCSSPTTSWATRSTGGTRGTSTPSPSRKSATSTTRTPGRCRRAGSTGRTTCRSIPAVARSRGCGRPRWPAWSTAVTCSPPGTA